jgi:hypothetical protein
VKERRSARIGTVSGLALLAGATAIAAVAGGAHSVFATVLLGLLSLGMSHALLDEIRRQAGRLSAGGWAVQDTVNSALLGAWSIAALISSVTVVTTSAVRAVLLGLFIAYALSCVYFVTQRRRALVTPRSESVDKSPTHAA